MTICDGTGTSPGCGTEQPHRHCVCGLPMRSGDTYCKLCETEQLIYTDVEMDKWDGRTYPSLRLRRTLCPNPEVYVWLVRAINGNPNALRSAIQGWSYLDE